ncbi:MAG: twin-arginine translocation pathway signal protein [Calditrichaeota bacterium]|nr:twin-arginine translocation pathway signal protein [Calditrichota bacterium]
MHDNQAFGPILFSQYTLSRGILKLTAQMPPIGNKDAQTVALQVLKENGKGWKTIQEAKIDAMARTATFRIENWDAGKDTSYRLAYNLSGTGNKAKEYEWRGTIRKEPLNKDEIVVAAFTGNNDLGFPNNDLVRNVKYHNPDFLFFSGDQIYERVGGYGTQRAPLDKATLDYLRKWYLYGWAYRDLLKDRPAVSIPDDHDVYHGNVWGAGGKKADKSGDAQDQQDSGGYRMPAAWVNMVQRTQTSHFPDPYDSTPVKQGIGVYYCEINYGGISFAVVEDRKWKSAPKPLLPKANIRNGWARNRKFDAAKEADVPGAVLLGKRQLHFLHEWADNWDENTWMKVVLSQTIFANVATLPEEDATSDAIVPKLRVLKRGEYPPDDIPVADMDSDGWPQTGRNKAIREMRRAFALHIAGDQHLGSTIQYGVDDWRDAGYAFCVPAISNVWPRRWFPKNPGRNRKPGAPKYTGDFLDGFGNHITVYAVSNPVFTGEKPATLYDRATGYGIVRFNRKSHDIVIECWPRESDPAKPDAQEYFGWPIKISQLENYGRKAVGYLPTIKVTGISDPVVQVINEKSGEPIYTLRIRGHSFTPKVFENGSYTVRVGRETGKNMKSIKGLLMGETKEKTITIKAKK